MDVGVGEEGGKRGKEWAEGRGNARNVLNKLLRGHGEGKNGGEEGRLW